MTGTANRQSDPERRRFTDEEAEHHTERLAYEIYEVIASMLDLQGDTTRMVPEDPSAATKVPAIPPEPVTVTWTRREMPGVLFHHRRRPTGDRSPHHTRKGSHP
jgi:hypothetical protein